MWVFLVVLPPSLLPLPFSSSHRATFVPPRPPLPHSEDTNGAAQTHPNWHNWCRRKWKSEWCGEGVEGVDCCVHSLLVQLNHGATAEHLSSSKPMSKNICTYVHISTLVYIRTCVLLCVSTYAHTYKAVSLLLLLHTAYCTMHTVSLYRHTYIRTFVHMYIPTLNVCMCVVSCMYVHF